LQLWEAHGFRVLDDGYNANADSVRAALQTLRELPCSGRRIAVLGDMAELGAFSLEAHAEVGRRAAELQISQLFAVGQRASVMVEAARKAGLNAARAFSDLESAAGPLKDFVGSGDLVLLKASRSMRFERLGMILRGASGEEHFGNE
jgi:UDP-N-acetylmuramoyl-tripeptide--D-alanyl-D-alanine ligase